MQVLKFGGTSVQNEEAINRVINIIRTRKEKAVIVVSAFATITNKLVEIIELLRSNKQEEIKNCVDYIFARHISTSEKLGSGTEVINFLNHKRQELEQLIFALGVLGEVSPKSTDAILSFGELMSSFIIYNAFKTYGFGIEYIDSRELIQTDSNFTEANVDFYISEEKIQKLCLEAFQNFDLIITSGFVASDKKGDTTTLGRGGSDYSAAIIASALSAEKLEIWTDVNGIMTCDPRIIKEARLVKKLSYSEASELAYFGAKVLHPKTIYPAVQKQIPVYVLNTFQPDSPCSVIQDIIESNKQILKAIAFRKNVTVINISSNKMLGAYGFLSKVFEIFKKHKCPVDLITTSEVSISLTIDDTSNFESIRADLEEFANINSFPNQAIICVVGEGIKNTAGIAARFFNALSGTRFTMVSIGASEVNISIALSEDDLVQSVRLLHDEFFTGELDKDIFADN